MDRATRHVSKFVLCITRKGKERKSIYIAPFIYYTRGFKQEEELPSRSFSGIGNGAIRWATYDFLLVFHCTVNEIISLISKNLKRSRDPEHNPFSGSMSCMHE